nr:C-rich 30-kDa protein [Limnephilus flavicornis]
MKVNMYHRGVVTFVLLAMISVVFGADQKCTHCQKTNSPTRHYTELGCKPKYKGQCIEQYDCPFIKNPPSPDKCYLNGHTFNLRDRVPNNLTTNNCVTGCFCDERSEGKAGFICAIIDCFEFFVSPDPKKINCIRQYKLESCCSENEVCDPDAIAALKTCTWESKDYKEGQRFDPTGSCKQCICTKDFDGTIKSPYCREIACGIGLWGDNPAFDKCGPIYFEGQNCCPISWQCASATDKITRKPGGNCGKPGPKCHYGDKLLNIGDTVQGDDKCVSCSCDVPPLISCVRKAAC